MSENTTKSCFLVNDCETENSANKLRLAGRTAGNTRAQAFGWHFSHSRVSRVHLFDRIICRRAFFEIRAICDVCAGCVAVFRTLSLVMQELLHTERDYIRALNYVVDHYVPEILSDSVPQPLRGKKSVVFGNLQNICKFHSEAFLQELEACAHSPFQLGACFLSHVIVLLLFLVWYVVTVSFRCSQGLYPPYQTFLVIYTFIHHSGRHIKT